MLPSPAEPPKSWLLHSDENAAVARMKASAAVLLLAVAAGGAAAADVAGAAEPAKPAGAVVLVARATKACFSASVQVTGFLVARREALVTLDADIYRVTEILAKEGDQVTAGQTLVRLARQEAGGQAGGGAAATVLRAPAAGTVTRATAILGATASPRAEPLFRIAI